MPICEIIGQSVDTKIFLIPIRFAAWKPYSHDGIPLISITFFPGNPVLFFFPINKAKILFFSIGFNF